MNTQKVDLYKKVQIETADQMSMILKLYDRVIHLLEKAKNEISEKKYEGKNYSLTKANDIVSELLLSLDQDKGGVIASSLSQLYKFVIREIMDANTNMNTKAIDNAKSIFSELRESWRKIDSNPKTADNEIDNTKIKINLSG